jgi:hypothetical protein
MDNTKTKKAKYRLNEDSFYSNIFKLPEYSERVVDGFEYFSTLNDAKKYLNSKIKINIAMWKALATQLKNIDESNVELDS